MKIKGLNVTEVFIVKDLVYETIEAFYTAESALNYIYEAARDSYDTYEEDESCFKLLNELMNRYLTSDKSKDYTIMDTWIIMKRTLT